MVHFWIVEMHYPDRVMRQLGYYQCVSPPPPLSWSDSEEFRKIKHNANHKDVDWAQRWSTILQGPGFEVIENRPYSDENYLAYLNWYWNRGMPSVYKYQQNDDAISQPLPQTASEDVPNLAYVEQGLGIARLVR